MALGAGPGPGGGGHVIDYGHGQQSNDPIDRNFRFAFL